MMRLAVFFLFGAGVCLAQSRAGYLVDSKCYDAEERNVNPSSTLMDVNRDRDFEIRYCTATKKTKLFAIVPQDSGVSLKLDSAANARAAELVRQNGRSLSSW